MVDLTREAFTLAMGFASDHRCGVRNCDDGDRRRIVCALGLGWVIRRPGLNTGMIHGARMRRWFRNLFWRALDHLMPEGEPVFLMLVIWILLIIGALVALKRQ